MKAAVMILALGALPARAAVPGATATALARCLDRSANASTAGQTDCEAAALESYGHRMNLAYAALLRRLPPPARDRLRRAQRVWLQFRAAETKARGALYATRRGTMYVPMAASDETNLTRDRALQLEGYLRVLGIEP